LVGGILVAGGCGAIFVVGLVLAFRHRPTIG
jgi:hypothetical protein